MSSDEYVHPKFITRTFKVNSSTLFRWAQSGKIKFIKTPGGQRLYHKPSILALLQSPDPTALDKCKVIYARVSSQKQKEDLDRQCQFLRDRYPTHRLITDIASGLNFGRKGLKSILDLAVTGKLEELVVSHRDRLCRFSFELIEHVIQKSGGKVVVLGHQAAKSVDTHAELSEDLLAVVNVFVAKNNGLRAAEYRKLRKQAKQINGVEGDDEHQQVDEEDEDIESEHDDGRPRKRQCLDAHEKDTCVSDCRATESLQQVVCGDPVVIQ